MKILKNKKLDDLIIEKNGIDYNNNTLDQNLYKYCNYQIDIGKLIFKNNSIDFDEEKYSNNI